MKEGGELLTKWPPRLPPDVILTAPIESAIAASQGSEL